MRNIDERYATCRKELESRGQEHVFAWWDSLDASARAQLITEIESISWPLVDQLLESHVRNKPDTTVAADLEPATVSARQPSQENQALYERARAVGQELIAAGKVAAFTLAGGQGTRLGFEGPKGAVTITPIRGRTLFQLFAEMIRAAIRRYDVRIPWYIMTNPSNHQQTVGFLRDHEFFGLSPDDVFLFSQGMLPSFDFQGKLLMADKHHLALSPDGHGGCLKALATSGALRDMKDRGIEILTYFQVDNPLVRPFDDLFVGLHNITKSEMSSKVTPKVDDLERVGNVCLADGRVVVIEYSNFPEEFARERNPDGTRKYDVGSLAMHLLDVAFIERVVDHASDLPYHRAEKTVTWLDENGFQRTPPAGATNAIKLEKFIFDALPLARNPLLLEIDRREEFSPVKNASGLDSVETAIRDQIRRAARWLESAGVGIPYGPDGEPEVVVEIAPSYATTAEDVQRKVTNPPSLHPGETIYVS